MHRLFLAATLGLCITASTPAQEAPGEWTPELALQVKRVDDVQVSPDGSRVAFVVGEAVMEGEKSEWVSHIHVAGVDGKDAFQLTRGEKSSTFPRWSPDGSRIAFLSARGEETQVWVIAVAGGEAQPLTDEKGDVASFTWSPDGTHLAFLMPEPPTEEEEKRAKEKRDARVVDEDLKNVGLLPRSRRRARGRKARRPPPLEPGRERRRRIRSGRRELRAGRKGDRLYAHADSQGR